MVFYFDYQIEVLDVVGLFLYISWYFVYLFLVVVYISIILIGSVDIYLE